MKSTGKGPGDERDKVEVLPPRFRKGDDRPAKKNVDEIHESDSATGESTPSASGEDEEAERSEDEDGALEAMEADPPALEKMFHNEVSQHSARRCLCGVYADYYHTASTGSSLGWRRRRRQRRRGRRNPLHSQK